MNISVGISTGQDPLAAAKEAAKQAKKNCSGKVDFAFVFSSVDFAKSNVLKTISDSLEGLPLLGSSSQAIISSLGVFDHGIIIMLVGLPQGAYFNIACVKNIKQKTPRAAGEELGEKLLYAFKQLPRELAIVLSDGHIDDVSSLVFGLQEKLGLSFPLAGGCASDALNLSRTYIYYNDELLTDASVALLLGGKLNYSMSSKHGWKPLGKPRMVTLSKGNIVAEIDGEPAIRLYQQYLASETAELKADLKRISMLYPLGIYVPEEEEYLIRNVISIEEKGILHFHGDVPQGSTVRLMIGTKESCFEASRQTAQELKDNLFRSSQTGQGERKKFILVFNSISRYVLLKRDADRDVRIIKETLEQDIPLIGLYTYGEHASLHSINYLGKAYFHNQTITVLGIGGK
ncbi:MAG: FIST N-terminal domain-containing protein [Candidatus Omnitrophota bacterium]